MGASRSRPNTELQSFNPPMTGTGGTKGNGNETTNKQKTRSNTFVKVREVPPPGNPQAGANQPPPPTVPKPLATPTGAIAANLSFVVGDGKAMAAKYEVDWSKQGELGAGHYATVFRGKNRGTSVTVAVKRVSRQLTREGSLRIEVEALRAVSGHPNIVELFDVYLEEKYMFLVLEMLSGGELFTRIVENGAYSELDAARHMRKIGSALKHMHDRSIVHRDLKPENLVLVDKTPNSEIKISDFGLSKMMKSDDETMMTICGTKAYSAPEVGFGLKRGETHEGYTSKVDMWSLGVIIYVIVAAYHPFDPFGNSDDGTIWLRITRGEWSFDDPLWSLLSDELKDCITKLITQDPVQRLSADEFLSHPWLAMADEALPSHPLPSLRKERSSKYWKVPAMVVGNVADAAASVPGTIINALVTGKANNNHNNSGTSETGNANGNGDAVPISSPLGFTSADVHPPDDDDARMV